MLDKNDLQAIAELISASVSASEERMKAYINEKVTDETNRSMAYTESVVAPKLDAIKDGLDLALETHIPVERIDRIEENITALKVVVRRHSEDIEKLKKAQ